MLIADLDYLEETTQKVTGGFDNLDLSNDDNANVVFVAASQFSDQEITGDFNNQENLQAQ